MKRRELISSFGLPLVVAALALHGCGGANPAQPMVAHGTLDLSQTLPAPTPTPFPTSGALGSRGGVPQDAQAAIAPYLKVPRSRMATAPAESEAVERTLPRRRASAALSAPPAPSTPDAPAVTTGTAGADDARLIASRSDTLVLDADRYADRQSRKAESYRGGEAIVIGAGTVLLVLLIVLLVVLLT